MKRLTGWMAVAILAAAVMCGCSKDDDGNKNIAPPQLKMVGADIDAVHEIEDKMSVKVEVAAPAGIKTFSIKIESPALSDALLGVVGLASEMDLVNPATPDMAEALKTFGFPVGEDVAGKKTLSFDISTLIPLIKTLPATASADHVFTLTVGDAKNQTTIKALKFHTSVIAVSYNDDADLWANTASLKVMGLKSTDGVVFEYKVKDAAEWQTATLTATDGGYTAKIEPTWEAKKNAAQFDVHTIKAGTGIFAAATYECRLMNNGKQVATTEFSTDAGDVIPNANMSDWSSITMKDLMNEDVEVAYPNASNDSFWGCGNNGVTTTLCVSTTEKFGATSPSAKLASMNMFVLAAGNLFTGSFNYASFTGTVQFGQKYTYSARPSALKLKYHATVGLVDLTREADDDHVEGVAKGDPDKARIFVAIVDWSKQHQVQSGLQTTTGAWDPEKGATVVTEGKVIGCGSMWITESTSGDAMQDAELDIYWYDKTAQPKAGNYSLVISCAANAYGDYMTGCSTNVMYVDDFEWVY